MSLGKMLSPEAAEGSDQLPYLTNRNVQWGRIELDELNTMSFSSQERKKYLLSRGDLLVTEGGEIGRTAIWDGGMEPLYFHKALHRLRAKGPIESRYMLHYMKHAADRGLFSHLSGQTSIAHLPQDRFASWCVVHPESLHMQRRISEILDGVDEWIALGRASKRKLHQAMASATQERLRDLIRHVRTTEPLEELGDVTGGFALGAEPAGGVSIELPYLRVANVQDGYIDTSEMKTVRIRPAELGRYALAPGDVLLTEGGDLDKLGRGAVWDGQIDPCLHQNHVFRVRCRPEKLLPEFLGEILASDYGKSYFLSVAKQTTNLASVNSSQVKAMPIPMLDLQDQGQFVAEVREWRMRLAVETESIQKLESLKQALSADLLGVRNPFPFSCGTPVPEEG